MPILPPGATAADRQRAADAQERRAEQLERAYALVALRLFTAEAQAIDAALASAETDAAVRTALDAILAAYRAPTGLFRRAWTEALGAMARAQYVAEAAVVARATAAVTGRPVPPLSAAQTVALQQAADARAAQAAAEITATSADRLEVVGQVVAPIPADVLRAAEELRARLTVPPVTAEVTATPVATPGTAPTPRPAVLQQRIDTLSPLVGREAAEQIVDQVAATLAKGQPTKAVARELVKTVTATPISRRRATLIARTESIALLSASEYDAVTAAGALNSHRWLDQKDARVRPSHKACAAQGWIPIDQAFRNGLMYPGQRPAPAREVIQCRCAASYTYRRPGAA